MLSSLASPVSTRAKPKARTRHAEPTPTPSLGPVRSISCSYFTSPSPSHEPLAFFLITTVCSLQTQHLAYVHTATVLATPSPNTTFLLNHSVYSVFCRSKPSPQLGAKIHFPSTFCRSLAWT